MRFIVVLLDRSMALLPKAYQPEQWIGFHLPGLGVLLSFFLLLITGFFVTNFMGQRLMQWSESLLERIPLVRSIYHATKQVIQAILSTDSQAFRKVLLIEYPRHGIWSIAFQTGSVNQEIEDHTGSHMVSIFVPTTPNPMGGFLIMLPKSEVIELNMSIDQALKFIISLGVMPMSNPETFKKNTEQ